MKPIFICAALICGLNASNAAPATNNVSARRAQALHFARGAHNLSVTQSLNGSQRRFYTLQVNAGQHLKISAIPDAKTRSQMVPIIFVTPPCGKFNGDKTPTYSEDSSRAGIYKIEVAPNMMASNARNGNFVLKVAAY